ncbi:MAG: response regulator [bacterium]|nr:response regulator [bacterium]
MARVLVIDDEQPARLVMRKILEAQGHEVEEALDGDEGLRMYRLEPADLVVTDILMPGGDGLVAIHELLREFPDAKILAVSGGGESGTLNFLSQAAELGAQRTLEKPFDIREFQQVVRELLEKE